MEKLLAEQEINQIELESFISNLKKTPKTRRTEGNLKKQRDVLENLWASIKGTNRKLIELYNQDKHAEVPYFKTDVYAMLQEKYFESHGVIYEFLKVFEPQDPQPNSALNNDSTTHTTNSHINHQKDSCEIPLPRIQIPTFSGGYQSWISFRDLFEGLIHNNRSLSKVQKLHYLQSSLNGEAKQLIKHFQIADANYDPAWELLKKRYQNERALINAQLQVLTSLPIQHVETSSNIKKFLDNLNECLEGLKILKIDIAAWNPILLFLLTQKLHRETVAQWELSLNNRINPHELPTISEFTEFLECRFRTLDAINRTKSTASYNENHKYRVTSEKNITKAFTVNAVNVCPICNQDHRLKQCGKFLNMSPKSRYDFTRSNGRCINCFSKSHSVKDCPNPMNCQYCNKRHNSLLHFNVLSPDLRYQNPRHQKQSNRTGTPNKAHTPGNEKQGHVRTHHIAQANALAKSNDREMHHRTAEQAEYPINLPWNVNNNSNAVATLPPNQHESHIQSHFTNQKQYATVLLATAIVQVNTPRYGHQLLRVLLDQGSQASFITESAVQRLKLNKRPAHATVSGIADAQGIVSHHMVSCDIQSSYQAEFSKTVDAYVLPKLTGYIPNQHVEPDSLSHLIGLQLADPQYATPGHIDMLLGADIYAEILLEGVIKGPRGYPIAQKTTLGWIISGKVPNSVHQNYTSPKLSLICNTSEIMELESLLQKFWELEDISPKKMLKPEEEFCEEIFERSHSRRVDGRYVVPLMFKDDIPPKLGDSRSIAVRRLLQMEKRFEKDQKLYEDYKLFMEEYIALGHMEKVNPTESNLKEYFLPHHAVLKESSSTTKVRVVFNGSSKTTNSQSLNDVLLTGPSLQQELYNILMRWRTYPIGITADIEKMYRQIYIEPSHTTFQKILWRQSSQQPMEEYKLLTVTYGTSCAPYLAIRTLMQLAHDEQNNFPLAAKVLLADFYVDDLLTGADTVEEAVALQRELQQLLLSGGFNLRKWASNSERLLNQIPEEYREITVPFQIEFDNTIKTLGIHWNPKNDTFGFKVSLPPAKTPVTKRNLLSEASKLFDPLGWLAPTVIQAKIMFQKLWINGLGWDDPLPLPLQTQWLQFREQLPALEQITIPRWIQYSRQKASLELHAFCDASTYAYAAVVYGRCILNDGRIIITLLAAKTKVAPIKQISIPRLELCGAHLLSNLVSKVKNSIQDESINTYAWTDSLNVLAWLNGHPRQWQTFIANRVSEIQTTRSVNQWSYVRSPDNPADCASRGVPPNELNEHSLWWTGPSWLQKPNAEWPRHNLQIGTDLERKKAVYTSVTPQDSILPIISRFSTLPRLLRVIAYCLRFYHNIKAQKQNRRVNELTTEEVTKARTLIERLVQANTFTEEIKRLQSNQVVEKTSKLYKLNPFIDETGILRIGGRIAYATIPYHQKFPIILPDKHHFTILVIQDCHLRTLHGGTQLTLNIIRKKYWILNARNTIRYQIHKCVKCFRYKAVTQQQLMGTLPSARVNQHRPFLHTGVDFSGYVTIKESRCRGRPKTSKGYISVFVCLSTKAIHLEFVSDLSSEAFLAAYRRFTSRRGLCSDIYSDCGSNFIGANQQLIKAKLKSEYGLTSHAIQTLTHYGTQWHFIPPAAPHFGGLWEAGVKSVKYHLKRILGDALLTYEEITTLLTQIEACLNSRPLCPLTNDPDDCNALTPGHFLIGDALLTPPEPNVLDRKINLLTRWQMLQRMLQDFWKRWIAEYLPRLQHRPKWAQPRANVEIGNLVLLKDERVPPSKWLLARILELHPGKDNLIRVVTLKVKDTVLKRPISKICLLPIDDNEPNLE